MNLDEFDEEKADFGESPENENPTEPEAAQTEPAAEASAEAPAPAAAPEPAAEQEAEAPAEAAEEDRPAPMIPKHRLDYIQSKRREAEQRAAELEARLADLEKKSQEAQRVDEAQPDPRANLEARLSELDVKIEEARLDGDTKTVAQMLAEQRRLEREYLVGGQQLQPQVDPEQVYTQVQERQQFDQLVKGLERAFPQFKEGNEAFDQDLVDEVLDMHAAFSARGHNLVDSMVKAANYVLRANGLLVDQPEVQEQAKPQAKRTTDVAKNVAAANAQPPALNKAGMDTDKAGVDKPLDISKMSLSDFEKLSDEAIAKMRGDFDV
jgi:hypothetical protein